jgi:hypothetical protein
VLSVDKNPEISEIPVSQKNLEMGGDEQQGWEIIYIYIYIIYTIYMCVCVCVCIYIYDIYYLYMYHICIFRSGAIGVTIS